MSTTTASKYRRARHTARYHAQAIASATLAADDYRKMSDAIEAAYPPIDWQGPGTAVSEEVRRLRNIAAEMDADVEACIEAAICDGWTPEDIEAAS